MLKEDRMSIPHIANEPSHHEFEIEIPGEVLVCPLQMVGNQGIRYANQQQRQMETMPRVTIAGLPSVKREEIAIQFNRKLASSERVKS
jgi:hypothetical protein